MPHTMLLDPVRILIGSDQDPIEQGAALIRDGALVGFGDDARQWACLLYTSDAADDSVLV